MWNVEWGMSGDKITCGLAKNELGLGATQSPHLFSFAICVAVASIMFAASR